MSAEIVKVEGRLRAQEERARERERSAEQQQQQLAERLQEETARLRAVEEEWELERGEHAIATRAAVAVAEGKEIDVRKTLAAQVRCLFVLPPCASSSRVFSLATASAAGELVPRTCPTNLSQQVGQLVTTCVSWLTD